MMMRNSRERGEGKLGCLFGLAVLLLAILIAWKTIPIKVKAAELRGVVADESKSAGTHKDDRIMKTILDKAAHLELPVTKDDVEIIRTNNNQISIDVKYTVPVAFPGYTYQWNFHHHSENPIF